jgi:transcription antitermination protein NusB
MAIDPHKMRELVLLLLYSFDMGTGEKDELIDLLKEECKVSRTVVEAALLRAQTIVQSLEQIDEFLKKVSHSYSIERIHTIERNVLRLGIFELVIEKELPPKVALAEAKRLAKKFSTDEAAIFVQTLLIALCNLEAIEIGV